MATGLAMSLMHKISGTATMMARPYAYLIVGAALLVAGGCTHTSDKGEAGEAVVKTPAAKSGEGTATPAAGAARTAAAAVPTTPLPPETCVVLSELPHDPPVVLPGQNVVLTRLMRPCVTRAGQRGYEKTTPYLAMGFPCTGGSGRIEVRGHYANPKIVSFLLGTDCGMAPASAATVQSLLQKAFALPAGSKLAAYTPFVVQYWEIPSTGDADIGYTMELRSAAAVEGLWRRFQQSQPIRVQLYGRENSWAQGDNFYSVEADLKLTGRTSFQLQLVKVKPLSKDETAGIRARCEALRPKRDCTDVF